MIDIKNIINNTKEYWNNMSGKYKKLIIGGSALLLIVALVFTLMLNKPSYVVLYSDINNTESAEILKELQASGIEYKYENTGDILIPKDQESLVRMQLAQLGYPKSGSNYDVFTQNIDFMTTDYEKKQYELFQLQERLQDSIKTIDGVQDAIVTISIPESKTFAWETNSEEASASVKLTMLRGTDLSKSQVSGVIQLITKSVLGLKEENVAIIDTDGNSLTVDDTSNDTTYVKLKVELENSIASDSQKNVTEFLSKIYGEENIKVSADVKINLDKKIEELLQYLPDSVVKESKTERSVTGPGETTGGVVGAEVNAEVPTYPGVTIQGDNIFFNDIEEKNYVISQLKQQIDYDKGGIDTLSIAVAINSDNMTPEDITKVRELVAYSEGTDIESVSVHSLSFYVPEPEIIEIIEETNIKQLIETALEGDNLIIYIIILAVILLLILIALIVRRKKKKKKKLEEAIAAELAEAEEKALRKPNIEVIIDKKLETDDIQTQQDLRDFADNNPQIVAQMIGKLLKGADE